jgi:hypothetical protein
MVEKMVTQVAAIFVRIVASLAMTRKLLQIEEERSLKQPYQ